MKETGITRHLDDMGRIVLPVELRRKMMLTDGSAVEIYTEGNRIILEKHKDVCIFCGAEKELTLFRGHNICADCKERLRE